MRSSRMTESFLSAATNMLGMCEQDRYSPESPSGAIVQTSRTPARTC